jgi:transcriptional regulator with GAF, ATPase, and Fis domain
VGSAETRQVDVRLVAATNCDLEEMVEDGSFRGDLFYRLNVFPVQIPPLRERGEDVVLLAEAFVRKLTARTGREPPPLSGAAKARLRRYAWPGNVRELENVMERAMITSVDGITPDLERALPDGPASGPTPQPEPGSRCILTVTEMQDLERSNLLLALEDAGWRVSGKGGAAERLGMNPNTLSSRMRSLDIDRPRS